MLARRNICVDLFGRNLVLLALPFTNLGVWEEILIQCSINMRKLVAEMLLQPLSQIVLRHVNSVTWGAAKDLIFTWKRGSCVKDLVKF